MSERPTETLRHRAYDYAVAVSLLDRAYIEHPECREAKARLDEQSDALDARITALEAENERLRGQMNMLAGLVGEDDVTEPDDWNALVAAIKATNDAPKVSMEPTEEEPFPMPAEPPTKPCPRCDGCGLVANTDDAEPWTHWERLPEASKMAVRMGS